MAQKTIAAVAVVVLLLTGCVKQDVVKEVEIQEVKVPFLYCPAPPRVSRPVLIINTLSPADLTDPGKVAQAYKASFIQIRGYAENLEQILQQYNETSEAYEDLRNQMKELHPDVDINELEREAVKPPAE